MFDPDPVKSDTNLKNHGFSFDDADRFDWIHAIETRDMRFPYDEVRTVAAGFIDDRLCIMTITRRGKRHQGNQSQKSKRERGAQICPVQSLIGRTPSAGRAPILKV